MAIAVQRNVLKIFRSSSPRSVTDFAEYTVTGRYRFVDVQAC